MSSFDLQGCGGDCVPVSAKALASFHVLKLAEGISVAVLGVPLARLGRIALPCSVPVTCGIGEKESLTCTMMTFHRLAECTALPCSTMSSVQQQPIALS